MYAHQVIEDLNDTKNKVQNLFLSRCSKNQVDWYLKNIDFFLKTLNNSIQFNFGDFYDVYSILGIDPKKQKKGNGFEILKEKICLVKFPFENCYFEYTAQKAVTVDKACTLVYSKDDHIFFMSACKPSNEYQFFLNPVISHSTDLFDSKSTYLIGLDLIPDNIKPLITTWAQASFGFSIVAQRILQCKNISTEKNYPSKELNKKRIKQGKQPLFTYHTLVVNPMSEKKRSSNEHESTGIKQRLHFCRGHFKEFTEQNKLFGKHTGLYWWQPMVRGNKELGIVHKDYLVKTA